MLQINKLCGTGFFVAQALALAKRPRGARLATLCERRCELTQIKLMLTQGYFILNVIGIWY
ncbi:hypothetical protein [Moorena sp. SIO4G3]|uniref:hypothetical protein n=1 Tax=Moorena sp. SIO4G3 TaxID=2607821 RepID=UPI00142AD0FF|nr:hypothetical protein [Moorena sp. SIO4G3]NEO81284.1 hypothetical protein [Moorena sp. SIO4G3]